MLKVFVRSKMLPSLQGTRCCWLGDRTQDALSLHWRLRLKPGGWLQDHKQAAARQGRAGCGALGPLPISRPRTLLSHHSCFFWVLWFYLIARFGKLDDNGQTLPPPLAPPPKPGSPPLL